MTEKTKIKIGIEKGTVTGTGTETGTGTGIGIGIGIGRANVDHVLAAGPALEGIVRGPGLVIGGIGALGHLAIADAKGPRQKFG